MDTTLWHFFWQSLLASALSVRGLAALPLSLFVAMFSRLLWLLPPSSQWSLVSAQSSTWYFLLMTRTVRPKWLPWWSALESASVLSSNLSSSPFAAVHQNPEPFTLKTGWRVPQWGVPLHLTASTHRHQELLICRHHTTVGTPQHLAQERQRTHHQSTTAWQWILRRGGRVIHHHTSMTW